MKMVNKWRTKVVDDVREYLEKQIDNSTKYKEAYTKALNPANAQLWVAVANLAKHMDDMNKRLSLIEKNVKAFDKKVFDEVSKNMKSLEKEISQLNKKAKPKRIVKKKVAKKRKTSRKK